MFSWKSSSSRYKLDHTLRTEENQDNVIYLTPVQPKYQEQPQSTYYTEPDPQIHSPATNSYVNLLERYHKKEKQYDFDKKSMSSNYLDSPSQSGQISTDLQEVCQPPNSLENQTLAYTETLYLNPVSVGSYVNKLESTTQYDHNQDQRFRNSLSRPFSGSSFNPSSFPPLPLASSSSVYDLNDLEENSSGSDHPLVPSISPNSSRSSSSTIECDRFETLNSAHSSFHLHSSNWVLTSDDEQKDLVVTKHNPIFDWDEEEGPAQLDESQNFTRKGIHAFTL